MIAVNNQHILGSVLLIKPTYLTTLVLLTSMVPSLLGLRSTGTI